MRSLLTGPDGAQTRGAALPAVAKSRPGDLWLCGSHRVLCEDATTEAGAVSRLPSLVVAVVGLPGARCGNGTSSPFLEFGHPVFNTRLRRGLDASTLARGHQMTMPLGPMSVTRSLGSTHQLLVFWHDPEEETHAAEIVVVVRVVFDDDFAYRFPVTNRECVGDDARSRFQGLQLREQALVDGRQ